MAVLRTRLTSADVVRLIIFLSITHAVVIKTTTAAPSECVSTGKDTAQLSVDIQSGAAIDEDVNTHSCTLDTRSYPWWVVDLGQAYSIDRVKVTLPNVVGDELNGLNNFQVGFPTALPTEGSLVDSASYEVCGSVTVGVTVGLVITVDCAATTSQYQYVIIQSVDTSAERLCIAEVCVFERALSSSVVTTTTASKTTTKALTVQNSSVVTTTTTASETTTKGPTDKSTPLILALSLGIGIAVIICIIILIICCCCRCRRCPMYGKCCKKSARHDRDEGATVNSQPLSDIISRPATTSYEPLDVTALTNRPQNYQQISRPPPQAGHDYDYPVIDASYLELIDYPSRTNS